MFNKFYKKSQIGFAIFWIVVYIVGTNISSEISHLIGIENCITVCFHLALTVFLIIWLYKNKYNNFFGLCKSPYSSKKYLFFLPLIILISTNFWFGININYSLLETLFLVISMLCVGFLEEIIFRGFLFKAMEKDNVKIALFVSSLTFGLGHIINLFMGSDVHLISNLCQIAYAMAVGFLFVIIFYRGKTLLPCIITHSLVNAFSVFNYQQFDAVREIIVACVIIFVAITYAIILLKTLPKENKDKENITQ